MRPPISHASSLPCISRAFTDMLQSRLQVRTPTSSHVNVAATLAAREPLTLAGPRACAWMETRVWRPLCVSPPESARGLTPTAEELARRLPSRTPGLRRCYERELAHNPRLEGAIAFAFQWAADRTISLTTVSATGGRAPTASAGSQAPVEPTERRCARRGASPTVAMARPVDARVL